MNGYSNALNPLSLVERLRGFGVMNFSHKPLRVNWLSAEFLVSNDYRDHFENLFNQLRRNLTGSIFWDFTHYQSSEEEQSCRDVFFQELKNIPSLFLDDENGRQIIAKKPHRLAVHGKQKDGVRTNTLVSVLGLIFSICRTVNFEILYRATLRDRKVKEKFEADVFRRYIRSMPFLKIEDENVICVDRSGVQEFEITILSTLHKS